MRDAVINVAIGGTIDFKMPTTEPGYDSAKGVFTITLTSGEIQIGRSVTISGPETAKIVISGNGASRVLNVLAVTVSISNLTIADGQLTGSTPQFGGPGTSVEGSGLQNAATFTLTKCTFTQHQRTAGDGRLDGSFTKSYNGGNAYGAGVFNSGVLTLSQCTFSRNTATSGSGATGNGDSIAAGRAAAGGAIYNAGALIVTGCTVRMTRPSGDSARKSFPITSAVTITGARGCSPSAGGIEARA